VPARWHTCTAGVGARLGAEMVAEGVPGDGGPFPQGLDVRGGEDGRRGDGELRGRGVRRWWWRSHNPAVQSGKEAGVERESCAREWRIRRRRCGGEGRCRCWLSMARLAAR